MRTPAQKVAIKFLASETPKPSIDARRLAAMVEWALDLGWTERQIADALPLCRSFSNNALEFTLRQDLVRTRAEPCVRPSALRACPVDVCGGTGWVETPDRTVVRCQCWAIPPQ